jgi:hypothetical protein
MAQEADTVGQERSEQEWLSAFIRFFLERIEDGRTTADRSSDAGGYY